MSRIFLVLLLIVSGCGNKQKEKNEVLFSLREMSDLATVEYTVTKIIKSNDNTTWFKIGDRRILMSCEAHLKAGIDMSGSTKKDITSRDKSIRVTLTQPQVNS